MNNNQGKKGRRSSSKGVSFDSQLDGVIHSLTKNNPSIAQNAKVSLAWEDITPSYIYKHTTGVTLRGSKLYISVDMPSVITDLTAMSESYKETLNEKMGGEVISSIRFSVVPRKPGERDVNSHLYTQGEDSHKEDEVESIALTNLEREQLKDSVSSVENPKLREALLKATIADLEWKKGIEFNKRAQKRN